MNKRSITVAAALAVVSIGLSACSSSGDLQKALTQKAAQTAVSNGDSSSGNTLPVIPPPA